MNFDVRGPVGEGTLVDVVVDESALAVHLRRGDFLDVGDADAAGVDEHREDVRVVAEVGHLDDGDAEGELVLIEGAGHGVDLDRGKDALLDVELIGALAGDVAVEREA